jgi:hypothetical protein
VSGYSTWPRLSDAPQISDDFASWSGGLCLQSLEVNYFGADEAAMDVNHIERNWEGFFFFARINLKTRLLERFFFFGFVFVKYISFSP